MSLVLAEKLLKAARLAFEGTAFDEAGLLVRRANAMFRQSAKGRVGTVDLMRQMDAFTVESVNLQADLAEARRAGLRVVRGDA